MRLTVRLDDDLYALARAVSKAEDCSLSTAVNLLLRRARAPRQPEQISEGFPVVRCHTAFTGSDVERLELLEGGG